MKLEIEIEKVGFENRIKEIKINGENFGEGVTKLMINADDSNVINICALTSKTGKKFINEELLKSEYIKFYVENEESEEN